MTQTELVEHTKDEILALLREINRPGIDKVIWYLNESTFFKEDCNSHHTFRGGLAVHSLGVYKEIKKLNEYNTTTKHLNETLIEFHKLSGQAQR